MLIKEFNSNNIEVIRKKIDEKLKPIAEELGIKINVGRITYNKNTFNAKLESVILNNDTENNDSIRHLKFKNNLKTHGWFYNLTEADFGRPIKLSGKSGILYGINPRFKNPIIVKCEDKFYKCSKVVLNS